MGAQLNSGVGNNAGMGGGKSMGGGQPQMGFGMDPNTGLPFGGQNPGQILGQGVDSILGATPIGGAFNQALGGQSLGNVIGGGVNTAIGQSPLGNMFGGQPQMGFGFNPGTGLPNTGMGGGKSGSPDLGNIISQATGVGGQMLNNFGLPQVGNAVSTVGQVGNNVAQAALGQPQMGFGMPSGGYGDQTAPMPQPMPQPVANRFAPPNAPGVRRAPAVSATNRANPRVMAPKPVSRNRLR